MLPRPKGVVPKRKGGVLRPVFVLLSRDENAFCEEASIHGIRVTSTHMVSLKLDLRQDGAAGRYVL
jgi:hypothetical protein